MRTDSAGKTVTVSQEHTVQQTGSLIPRGALCGFPPPQRATGGGGQSRTSSSDLRNAGLQGAPGHPVNVDGQTMQTSSRQAMHRSFIPHEDRYDKAIRTGSPQAQASKKPRLALAASSGPTGSQGPRRLASLPRDALGRAILVVADPAWDCRHLRQARHTQDGVAVLTPVPSAPKRLAECEAVSLEKDAKTVWGHVAALSTTMTDCDGPDVALSTPACTMTADPAMPTATTRWRLANFFAEHACLGLHHRPSLNRHALQTMLALRLLAFPVVHNCRHALGPASQKKTPALLPRACIDGVQGRVPWRGNRSAVHLEGLEPEAAAAAIVTTLDTTLDPAGVDPRSPWLGNRRLPCTCH